MRATFLRIAILALVATGFLAPPASALAPLTLAIQDPVAFQGGLDSQQRSLALAHASRAGARIVRLGVAWRDIATRRPANRKEARDPNWNGYHFDEYDREVRAVTAAGMQPLLVPVFAPDWAEGKGTRPYDTPAGTWKPQPGPFADFGHALAARYSGSTRDAGGQRLPRVKYYQPWNEPNVPEYINPQVEHNSAASPAIYRRLLNAFYPAVKSVHSSNFVVFGGLAPYGDYPVPSTASGGRLPPIYFARLALCVSANGRSARHCPRVRFDAFAVHSFPKADPRQGPLNALDLRLRVNGINSALARAARAGTISRGQSHKLWMTELAWNGGGPDAGGGAFDLATQANFLQIAFYMLWREGVDAVFWYNIRDHSEPGFVGNSGLYTYGGAVEQDGPKPALTAFRFPFVAIAEHGRTIAWGRAPTAGKVIIEQANGKGGWRVVAKFNAGRAHVFLRTVPKSGPRTFRARQGSLTSLAAKVTTAKP